MSTVDREDKLADAKRQGAAQFESIAEMVAELERFCGDTAGGMESSIEDAERAIQEDALSVQVRSGWYNPGDSEGAKPAEYEILLCTGGPAVRIIGELNEYMEPDSARIEVQDWFQPWTELRHYTENKDALQILLTYARQFYFGEA
ncbi:MAG: hypothetical protein WA192_06340 [Candidatus Acidiferrales bacterium]